ncbi:MAG TPA: hypothetical protein VEB60_00915, partial [Candidatus Paceibacterota bacterium]|nr:hypothetical protein [Candidatus Paceibacterota bacterium]
MTVKNMGPFALAGEQLRFHIHPDGRDLRWLLGAWEERGWIDEGAKLLLSGRSFDPVSGDSHISILRPRLVAAPVVTNREI